MKVTPTEHGKVTWDPDGYYDGVPCTCEATCPGACKGSKDSGCNSAQPGGCAACNAAYQDFLSAE